MGALASRVICGKEFQSERLAFDAGWTLGVKLVGLLGSSAPKSIAELGAGFDLVGVFEKLPAAILRAGAGVLLGECLARTYWLDGPKRRCLAESSVRDTAFDGDYVLAVEVLYFALETNYRDSLQAAASRLGAQSPAP